jgi:Domain of unknown function (DUF1844)
MPATESDLPEVTDQKRYQVTKTDRKTETMSDTPKFEVIDRRKFKAEEEQEGHRTAHPTEAEPEASSGGPRLVVSEGRNVPDATPVDLPQPEFADEIGVELPPPPTAEASRELKVAYEASAQRLEELIRAQNPAMGPQPAVTFAHLVQQFYVSAMIQMGAGAQEGQRPRVDILGAHTTIDLLGVLEEKTRGNLTEAENRVMQSVLFEVRFAFNELTSMINLQAMQPPQPPPPKR